MDKSELTNKKTNEIKSSDNLNIEAEQAFRRSTVIRRSPPQTTITEQKTDDNAPITAVSQRRANRLTAQSSNALGGIIGSPASHHNSEAARQLQQKATPKSAPSPPASTPKISTLFELVERLGKEIDGLLAYVEPRKNVHGDIRKMCSIIKCTHTDVITQLEAEERRARQISMPVRMIPAASQNSVKLSAKRARDRVSPKTIAVQTVGKSPSAKKRKNDNSSPRALLSPGPKEEWTKVQKKKPTRGKKLGRSIRPRLDAIIIEKKVNGMTYADMLRLVRNSEELKDLSEKVKTMRPTQKGGLAIELKRSKDQEAQSCRAAIEKALENVATVNLKTHNITIQCRGLIPDLSTDDEIVSALAEQAQVRSADKSSIKSRRNTPGGTESVYISLHADDAKKVLGLGHIKVGWIRCRVSEVISPKRCYKCWAFDHVSSACKGKDRTKLCRRCGMEGHHAATCKNAEKCALCDGAHAAGSGKCPRYQEAVRKLKA